MSQFTEGDSAVNRLNAAVSAFEKVLTEPEGTVVEMPIGAAQPSLAERLKRALDAVTVKPAQAASQATAAAQQAQSAQQAAAQSAADAANSAVATGYVAPPFPDVWAPLNDDLRLLAGFAPADTITVAGTSYPLPSKSLTFARATTATYIDKSGVLQTAAINAPRFEKEGLLIEGQSTNYIRYSNDPTQWKSTGNVDSTLTLVSAVDGDTKAPTGQYTTTAAKQNMNLLDHKANMITLAIGGTLSASCRVKLSANLRIRVRIGNDSAYMAGVYYNSQGELVGSPDKVVSSAVLGSDGYITIKTTYTADVASSTFFVQFIIYDLNNPSNNIAIGETCSLQMPQVEAGPYASSFIVSGATPTTRAADDCTLQRSGNDNWWGPITISLDMHCNGPSVADGTANSRRGILSFYPTTTEYAMLMLDSSTSNLGKYLFAYGPATFNTFNQKVDDGAVYRLAATSDMSQVRAFVNGANSGSPTPMVRPTPGTTSNVNTLIYLGRGAGANASGSRMLNGHIRNLRIWHRALSDIQIKGLR